MEITGIETHLVQDDSASFLPPLQRYLLVEVHTDEGVTGIGEAGSWAHLHATETAIDAFEPTLVGKDPLRRDHLWQILSRSHHFRGAVLAGATSAIDLALWDVAGKYLGVPVYELLGGQTRHRARAAYHARGDSRPDLRSQCLAARDAGFTVIGPISPFTPTTREQPYGDSFAHLVDDAVEGVETYRDAVGPDCDLVIELHRRLDPGKARVVVNRLARFDPIYVEDPVPPDSIEAMARVSDAASVPIGTGERFHDLAAFESVLARGAAQYVRLDLGLAGGFTNARKIAAVAEAHHASVSPHLVGSPVTLAASLHLAASIPNFALQGVDYDLDAGRLKGESLFEGTIPVEDGYLIVPDSPGIGLRLDHDALATLEEPAPREMETRLHEDGSVVDH